MKYIRLEDGVFNGIFKLHDLHNGHYKLDTNDKCVGFYEEFDIKDCKQANTIDELVDGYWWENEMYDEPIFIPNWGLVLDRIQAWKESDKILNSNLLDKITIYGSIYNRGKGWSHVSKVNMEKEDLEIYYSSSWRL